MWGGVWGSSGVPKHLLQSGPRGEGRMEKVPIRSSAPGSGLSPSERAGRRGSGEDRPAAQCVRSPPRARSLAPRGRLSRSQQPHAVSSFNSNFYSRPSPPQQPRGARTPRTPTLSLPVSVPHSPISGPREARRWAPRAPPAAPGRYPSFIAPRRSVTQ